jgi:succinate dehydrogenase/fumarate reductase flavoprotein subunit
MKARRTDLLDLTADVLVIGGGPAGCWAALSALEAGASVVLVEKGYTGTSGPTAAGNSSIVDTPPGSEQRRKAVAQRADRGLGLVDEALVDRVYDQTHAGLNRLLDWGYRFPRNDEGQLYRGSMRGVDYLRFMRQRLIKKGAVLLDQSPALKLLVHDHAVAGAAGVARIGGAPWRVRAGAVVLATGGCAFLSGALGTNNNTGDGYLMAAELGARLSGMEFTGQYGIAPAHTPVTKGIIYYWASFFDEAGNMLEAKGDRQDIVASGLKTGKVFAQLNKADARVQSGMRGQANVFLPFDRQGIDPFTEKFEVTMLYEGTVRGTGGILIDETTATDVAGLFAAGDAASRVRMAGATSGGGGPNASWAMATGTWAGEAAAKFARSLGTSLHTRVVSSAGPAGWGRSYEDPLALRRAVQDEILPLDRSFHRTRAGLDASAEKLAAVWSALRANGGDQASIRAFELRSMAASARWIVASARYRQESRGIHRRIDLQGANTALGTEAVLSGGLDAVWTGFEHQIASKVSA